MSLKKILVWVGLCVGGAVALLVSWAALDFSRDDRPVVNEQGGVPDPVLARVKEQYLSDPGIAARPGEVARHRPWKELVRYHPGKDPFGGARPLRLEVLPGFTRETERTNALLQGGRFQEAAARLRKAMDGGDASAMTRFQWARVLQERGQMERALEELGRVAAEAPGYAPLWVQTAIVLNDLQRGSSLITGERRAALVARALLAMDKAQFILGEGDHMVHLQRGIVLCFAHRFEESEWDLWRAVKASPRDGNAYWDIAWLEAQRGDGAATVRAMRFAARDPRLFAMRTCQEEVLCDPFFQKVSRDPVFLAWVRLLPERCAVVEGVGGWFSHIAKRIFYLVRGCGR